MGQMQTISSNNTRVTIAFDRESDALTRRVVLHGTEVVKMVTHQSDSSKVMVTLNSSGWQSVTTKARMNQTSNEYRLNFRVYAEKKVWYVAVDGDVMRFHDGIGFEATVRA